MFTFISVVLGIIWAIISLVLLFKVWDKLGPVVLSISNNHIVQIVAMIIVYGVIFGIPVRIWSWLWS